MTPKAKDYYAVLGLSRTAGTASVKAAYRSLAKQHHPDVAGEAELRAFQDIVEAYEVLANPSSRRAYNESLAEAPPLAPAEQPADRRGAIKHQPYCGRPEPLIPSKDAFIGGRPRLDHSALTVFDVQAVVTQAQAAAGLAVPLAGRVLYIPPFAEASLKIEISLGGTGVARLHILVI